MLVLKWKEIAFIEKVDSRCFCWFPADVLVHRNGTPIWRLHTKLYKVAWNILANNSETVGHKDLRLGQIVCIHALVFYNISFSWLLPLDSSQFIIFFANLGVWTDLKHLIHFSTSFSPWSMYSLKKHSVLFPFSLLKIWGDCLFCGWGGGGGLWNAF